MSDAAEKLSFSKEGVFFWVDFCKGGAPPFFSRFVSLSSFRAMEYFFVSLSSFRVMEYFFVLSW
jgi:hypothetical protein